MKARAYLGSVLALAWLFLCALARPAAAAPKTFTGSDYSITFTDDNWDTLTSSSILGKGGGFNGIATLGAEPGTSLPDVDSIALALGATFGGKFTKDSSGIKTLGTYEVHWQKYTYDSVPVLSALISSELGFKVSLRNGRVRVYYLLSGGYAFTIASMSLTGDGPNADIERAIPSLKLGSAAGIREAAPRVNPDLWIRKGRLGGAWLQSHRPISIDGFNARGVKIGSALPVEAAGEGAWILPASAEPLFLRVRTADGAALLIPVLP